MAVMINTSDRKIVVIPKMSTIVTTLSETRVAFCRQSHSNDTHKPQYSDDTHGFHDGEIGP